MYVHNHGCVIYVCVISASGQLDPWKMLITKWKNPHQREVARVEVWRVKKYDSRMFFENEHAKRRRVSACVRLFALGRARLCYTSEWRNQSYVFHVFCSEFSAGQSRAREEQCMRCEITWRKRSVTTWADIFHLEFSAGRLEQRTMRNNVTQAEPDNASG